MQNELDPEIDGARRAAAASRDEGAADPDRAGRGPRAAPRGRFIVVEGVDGAGTTTQAWRLAEALGAVYARQPSGGVVGRYLRQILAGAEPALSWRGMALLFAADRAELWEHAVAPKLAAGETVVSDRHTLSTELYQGATGGDPAWLRGLAAGLPAPDVVVILDVGAAVAAARRRARPGAPELFDDDALQARLAGAYAAHAGPGVVHVDGERAVDVVAADVRAAVGR